MVASGLRRAWGASRSKEGPWAEPGLQGSPEGSARHGQSRAGGGARPNPLVTRSPCRRGRVRRKPRRRSRPRRGGGVAGAHGLAGPGSVSARGHGARGQVASRWLDLGAQAEWDRATGRGLRRGGGGEKRGARGAVGRRGAARGRCGSHLAGRLRGARGPCGRRSLPALPAPAPRPEAGPAPRRTGPAAHGPRVASGSARREPPPSSAGSHAGEPRGARPSCAGGGRSRCPGEGGAGHPPRNKSPDGLELRPGARQLGRGGGG